MAVTNIRSVGRSPCNQPCWYPATGCGQATSSPHGKSSFPFFQDAQRRSDGRTYGSQCFSSMFLFFRLFSHLPCCRETYLIGKPPPPTEAGGKPKKKECSLTALTVQYLFSVPMSVTATVKWTMLDRTRLKQVYTPQSVAQCAMPP